MTKLFKDSKYNYTNINNQLVRDDRLSWKARGIFSYLWSQSDSWNFYVGEIAKHSPDGKTSLQTGLKELEELGYLKRKPKQDNQNKLAGFDWILSDFPSDRKPVQRETRPTENQPLRTKNLKNYQQQELTTNKKYSPAKAEPHVPYSEIVEYLNQKAATGYKATTKKTQQLVKARFNEGFNLDDFKKVIDNKTMEWKNTDMAKFLRPETLFGTKFESYLNQKPVSNGKSMSTYDPPLPF